MPQHSLDGQILEAADWIETFVHLPTVDSTNDLAKQIGAQGAITGPLLVIADKQTAGRGRFSNAWWSSPGSVTLSLALPLSMLAHLATPLHAIAFGLAVRDAIEAFAPGHQVHVKWPNDVLLDHRKVAGILIENSASPHSWSIVGIGVNLNNALENAPPEIRCRANSVSSVMGKEIVRAEFVNRLLRELCNIVRGVRTAEDLLAAFRLVHWLTGKRVEVRQDTEVLVGRCTGLNDQGALLVERNEGVSEILYGSVECVSD